MSAKVRTPQEEMGFWDHLDELRTRLIRSVAYVAVGAVGAWFFGPHMLAALEYPALAGAKRAHFEHFAFRIFEAAGGIMLMVKISLVAGVVLASPLLTLELWGFIAPALRPGERRWVTWAVPAATFLFLLGVATCYWISPTAFRFFFVFNKAWLGVQPELTLAPYISFFLQLLLVFGVLFELPLFLMVLGSVGLVKSSFLLDNWRWAIVIIVVVAAVVTPTTDALTMTVLALPMIGLYLLSIVLVRFVEKKSGATEVTAAPAPGAAAEGEAGATASAEPVEGPSAGEGAAPEEAPEEVDIDEMYRQMYEERAEREGTSGSEGPEEEEPREPPESPDSYDPHE